MRIYFVERKRVRDAGEDGCMIKKASVFARVSTLGALRRKG